MKLWRSSLVALVLSAFPLTAKAEKPICELGSDVDAVAFAVSSACRWEFKNRTSVGVVSTWAYSFQPVFSPFFEIGLLTGAMSKDGSLVAFADVGVGSFLSDANVSSYLFAFVSLTGMGTAPYVSELVMVYPRDLGPANTDGVLFRSRLGVKTEARRFMFIAGLEHFAGTSLTDWMIFQPFISVSREL